MMRAILIYSFLILFTASCYYDKEESLYGTTECSTDEVTFNGVVAKIIDDNCYRCHDANNNFGGITLEGYNNLKPYVDSGELLGAIKRQSGFSAMPKNEPPLLDCDIEKIEVWITAGALNN